MYIVLSQYHLPHYPHILKTFFCIFLFIQAIYIVLFARRLFLKVIHRSFQYTRLVFLCVFPPPPLPHSPTQFASHRKLLLNSNKNLLLYSLAHAYIINMVQIGGTRMLFSLVSYKYIHLTKTI